MPARTPLLIKANFLTKIFLSSLLVLIVTACAPPVAEQAAAPVIRPIKLLTVGATLTGQTRKLPGTIRATDRVDLAFQVAGPLVELPVKEGQRVKKGQLLARIDPKDYQTSLLNAQGVVAKAQASLEFATAEYQRYLNVKATDAGAVSASVVALKKTAQTVAKADLQSAQAGLAANLDRLEYTQLRAPFAGVVARKYVDNFQEVTAKQAILSLQNITDIEVLVSVPESMVMPIRKAKPRIYADFAADPARRFELTVKEASLLADNLTQTYQVVLVMPAPTGIRILPGMTANVSFEFDSTLLEEPNIIVPAIAVLADDASHATVWVVDSKTMAVHRRIVTTGDLTGVDSINIAAGLNPNEVIAISGVSKLQEGQVVRALE